MKKFLVFGLTGVAIGVLTFLGLGVSSLKSPGRYNNSADALAGDVYPSAAPPPSMEMAAEPMPVEEGKMMKKEAPRKGWLRNSN